MLRTEIIAQIDAEIDRLVHARDILAGAPTNRKKASARTGRNRTAARDRKQSEQPAVPGSNSFAIREISVSAPPDPAKVPSIQFVPPKRRMERQKRRRGAGAGGADRTHAALGGVLPSGPIAVSANEVRKAEARAANPPLPPDEVSLKTGSERSLGTLVRAFERNSRLNDAGAS